MQRREKLLKSDRSSENLVGSDINVEGENHLFSIVFDNGHWPINKKTRNILEVVRELIDFQLEILRHQTSFRATHEFIKDKPEEMVNRIISHLMYLFEVASLDGLIPRLNHLYLINQEMKNFLNNAREILCVKVGDIPDSSLLVEIQNRILQSMKKDLAN